ncbi:hypothetical protein CVE37_24050 [Pseudomonas syringae pv. actinidiae]|nr:hypothetical protein [Pseudomonas syringae pv. actinidiae]
MGASGGYDGCDGLRSGPETDHLGCVWRTEVAGFAAGSRQFADKRSVARSAATQARFCPVRADNANQNVAFARPSR